MAKKLSHPLQKKVQTERVKVQKSLWSLGPEQNANQPTCLWKGHSYCGNYWSQQGALVLREKLYYHSIFF